MLLLLLAVAAARAQSAEPGAQPALHVTDGVLVLEAPAGLRVAGRGAHVAVAADEIDLDGAVQVRAAAHNNSQ